MLQSQVIRVALFVGFVLACSRPLRAGSEPTPQRPQTRILLELSRGYFGDAPSALRALNEPAERGRYVVSRNFGPLRPEVLNSFDVVIVCGDSGRMVNPPTGGWPPSILKLGYAAPYEPGEAENLAGYVRSGGAIIVMGCGPLWAAACQRSMRQTGQVPWPIERMPLNQLCSPLELAFTDRFAKRPDESWRTADRQSNPLMAGTNSVAVAMAQDRGGVLAAGPNTRVLMAPPDRAPGAVVCEFGQGTVIAIGLEGIRHSFMMDASLTGMRELIDFAASATRTQRRRPPTERLYLPGKVAETQTSVILALPCMAERAREVASVADHAEAFIPRFFGFKDLFELAPERRRQEKLRILVRVSGPAGSAGQIVQVGGYSNNQQVPVHHEITHIIWPNELHPVWFGEAIASHVAGRNRADLGYVEYAAQNLERERAELAVYERQHGIVDLAKCPDRSDSRADRAPYFTKAYVVFAELERRHGEDFFKRYVAVLRGFLAHHPDRSKRMTLREQVGLFSEAASVDLAPWLRSIGTTVD